MVIKAELESRFVIGHLPMKALNDIIGVFSFTDIEQVASPFFEIALPLGGDRAEMPSWDPNFPLFALFCESKSTKRRIGEWERRSSRYEERSHKLLFYII